MDYRKKYRWALTGLILMLILNLGILTAIWVSHPPKYFQKRSERDRSERFHEYIAKRLDLSEQQKKSFHNIRERHMGEIRQIVGDLRSNRKKYFEILKDPVERIDTVRADSLAGVIARQETMIERSIFDHFYRFRKELTPEQQEKFNEMIDEIIKKLNRSHSRNSRRGRGPGIIIFQNY